ncbi:MAG: trimeric intracellular cation channel family protein [Sphaerochaeta sp.]|nr:trimeric intracellular cation channel family protein [Sphaerochaeta sp.]
MDSTIMYIFDLLGTCVFAITGAVRGVRHKLDFLGVVVFACTVGVGGGVFRDVLLGATPVAAYEHESYLIVCIVTGVLVFFLAPQIVGRWHLVAIGDAIGLGIFTALGAAKGLMYGAGPIGIVLSGVFSAVVGGVLRDVMVRVVPAVLTSDFYATASLIGGLLYVLLSRTTLPFAVQITVTAITVTTIRLLAMRFKIHLPVARYWVEIPDDMDVGKKKR